MLFARIFPRPFGAWKNATQLANIRAYYMLNHAIRFMHYPTASQSKVSLRQSESEVEWSFKRILKKKNRVVTLVTKGLKFSELHNCSLETKHAPLYEREKGLTPLV